MALEKAGLAFVAEGAAGFLEAVGKAREAEGGFGEAAKKAAEDSNGAHTSIIGSLTHMAGIAAGIATAGVAGLAATIAGGVSAYTDWAGGLNDLSDTLGTTSTESAGLTIAIQRVGGNVDAVAGQMVKLTKNLVDSKGHLTATGKELKDLGINAYETGKSITTTGTALSGVKVDKLSGDLVTATARLHDMEAAMSKSHHPTETQTLNLEKMRAKVAELTGKLSEGGKVITSTLTEQGPLKPAAQLLQEVANKIAAMPEGLEKTNLMVKLFGRSGKDLNDTMNALANGGLQASEEMAKKLGLAIGEDGIDKAKEFDKGLADLGFAAKGFAVSIGGAVLPVLVPMIQKFAEWATNIMPKVREAIDTVRKALEPFLKTLGALFQAFVDGRSPLKNILPSFGDVGAAISGIGTRLGELPELLTTVTNKFKSGDFVGAVTALVDGITRTLTGYGVGDLANRALDFVNNFLTGLEKDFIPRIPDLIKKFLGGFTDSLSSGASDSGIVSKILAVAGHILTVLLEALQATVSAITPYLVTFIGNLGRAAGGLVANVVTAFVDWVKALVGFPSQAKDSDIKDGLLKFIGRVVNLALTLATSIRDIGLGFAKGVANGFIDGLGLTDAQKQAAHDAIQTGVNTIKGPEMPPDFWSKLFHSAPTAGTGLGIEASSIAGLITKQAQAGVDQAKPPKAPDSFWDGLFGSLARAIGAVNTWWAKIDWNGGLVDPLARAIGAVNTWFANLDWNGGLVEPLARAIGAVNNWWAQLVTQASTVVTGISTAFQSGFADLNTAIETILTNLNTTAETKFTEMDNAIATAVTNLWTALIVLLNQIKASIQTAVTSIQTWLTNTWNQIKTTVTNIVTILWTALIVLWNQIKTSIQLIVTNIQTWLTDTWNTIKTAVINIVTDLWTALTNIWNSIQTDIQNIVTSIQNWLSDAWNSIRTNIDTTVSTLRNDLVGLWNTITSNIQNALNNIKNSVSDAFNNVRNSIVNSIQNAIDGVKGMLSQFYQIGSDFINNIVKGINDIGWKIKNTIMQFVNDAVNNVMGAINHIKDIIAGIWAAIGSIGNVLANLGAQPLPHGQSNAPGANLIMPPASMSQMAASYTTNYSRAYNLSVNSQLPVQSIATQFAIMEALSA